MVLAIAADDLTTRRFFSASFLEFMRQQRILSQPVKTEAVPDGLLFSIVVPPGINETAPRLMLQSVEPGLNALVAHLEGHAPSHWTQFVVPWKFNEYYNPRCVCLFHPVACNTPDWTPHGQYGRAF